MPLLVMCGIPGAGKSRRALDIKNHFEQNLKYNVVLINEENCSLIKEKAYSDAQQEKITRAFLKSNVEKNIDQNTLVILDSMNYIKGYRYELFCLARSAKTQHCVFFCNTNAQKAFEFNEQNENKFSKELFEDYKSRIEIPNQKNRWDSPLIELREDEETPFNELVDILINQEKKSRDPVSTKNEIKMDTNYLYEVDKILQQCIDKIMQIQQDSIFQLGNPISFTGCKEKLVLHQNVSLITLKKIKQSFGQMLKERPPQNLETIEDGFLFFLQKQLEILDQY